MGDYDYANARLRALKSRLFDMRAYAEILGRARLDDLIARLLESPYADEVKAALARYAGARVVMEACRLNLAHTFQKLRGFFDDDGARLVSILLARWDLFNLKTILRGQAAGARPEEMLEALVPTGSPTTRGAEGLDESALRTLTRQPDVAATVDLLRTWNLPYARDVQNAFAEFTHTRDWSAFETALDSIFYAHWSSLLREDEENNRLVREFLAREIDAVNLMTALRLRELWRFQEAPARAMAEGASPFLRGGTLAWDWLKELVRTGRDDDALVLLRASRFGDALADIAFAGDSTLDLAKVERALEHANARYGIAFFQRDPLTIAPAIGFLAAKNVEVKNLRVIAQGLALGVPRGEIENELVV